MKLKKLAFQIIFCMQLYQTHALKADSITKLDIALPGVVIRGPKISMFGVEQYGNGAILLQAIVLGETETATIKSQAARSYEKINWHDQNACLEYLKKARPDDNYLLDHATQTITQLRRHHLPAALLMEPFGSRLKWEENLLPGKPPAIREQWQNHLMKKCSETKPQYWHHQDLHALILDFKNPYLREDTKKFAKLKTLPKFVKLGTWPVWNAFSSSQKYEATMENQMMPEYDVVLGLIYLRMLSISIIEPIIQYNKEDLSTFSSIFAILCDRMFATADEFTALFELIEYMKRFSEKNPRKEEFYKYKNHLETELQSVQTDIAKTHTDDEAQKQKLAKIKARIHHIENCRQIGARAIFSFNTPLEKPNAETGFISEPDRFISESGFISETRDMRPLIEDIVNIYSYQNKKWIEVLKQLGKLILDKSMEKSEISDNRTELFLMNVLSCVYTMNINSYDTIIDTTVKEYKDMK